MRPAAKAHCTVLSLQDKRGILSARPMQTTRPLNHPNIYTTMIPQKPFFVKEYIYIIIGEIPYRIRLFGDVFLHVFPHFLSSVNIIF